MQFTLFNDRYQKVLNLLKKTLDYMERSYIRSTIDDTNIVMPEWDFNAPSSVTAWEEASNVYAEQVSGEIRAVVGSELRPGNIWENIELPRLKANPNVTKITTIDPKTGVEKIIFER